MPERTRDVVVVGTHPFGAAVPLGDWHLARTLARHHRVLWVDPPASPLAPLRGAASRAMFRWRPVQVNERLFVGSPVVHSGRVRPSQAPVVDGMVAAQVCRWMDQLGMQDVDLLVFSSRFGMLDRVPRRTLTAWLKDRDWAADAVPHADWLRARQEQLVRAADVVVGVSEALVADCRGVGVNANVIPNGCEADHFGAASAEPTSMRRLDRPRLIFSGAWNWRVDTSLFATLTSRLPAFTFIVVGAGTADVPTLPNVQRLPAVSYSELPAYLQAADVGIVPYRLGEFNSASCPLKVYEYLASGLPVVASGVSIHGLREDLVRVASDADQFVAALEELAIGDRRRACRLLAADHSWDSRAHTLLGLIDAAQRSREEVVT